ncbi:hypothetical protein BK784_03965 [Bacillus thuringiensis serovar medellin]|uniref:Uncharacterized protein n=1 Tax=Bacillus thuringiensis subsp. medellin TaxID=79672 RepID=A0A9X6N724_BACTV|nr:hypothetical protein [Bacillus thuringiensis]OUC03366.1 hypothetical protein BK784_03965 [Bacillus thuringiensis serovar medellin]
MNKGDAILRLLMEIKLELKEVKEQMERMQTKIEKIEQQNKQKQVLLQSLKKPKHVYKIRLSFKKF